MKFARILVLTLPFMAFTFAEDTKVTTHPAADDPSFTVIFDGKNLSKIDTEGNWQIQEDGSLHLTPREGEKGWQRYGSYIWLKDEYADFVVDFEFKFGKGTVDSGFFMRNDHDQIQIGISGSLKRDMTGSPYIPGKGYPVEAKGVKKLLKMKDWNAMKIVTKGPTYTVWLNGKQVMTYKSDSAIERGPIGIQLHGNRDMQIDYRNIKIGELKK